MTTIHKAKKHYKAPRLTMVPMAPHCMFTASEEDTKLPIDPDDPVEEYD